MFERFTEGARRALFFARFEVSELGGPAIEAEHLLLGILHQEGSFAAGLLGSHGLNVEGIREYVRNQPAETPSDSVTLPGSGALDPIVSLERIRFLAEQLSGSQARRENAPFLLDEIHQYLDELKRRLASEQ